MKIHRFFGDFNLNFSIVEIFNKKILHQLKNVLRFRVGDKIILCDVKMGEAIGEISEINKNFAKVKIEKVFKNENEPKNYVSLYCAVLKKENFELVAQKATEIGVKEIIPVIAERTVKFGFKPERLEKIIKEAAEQSGRGILPILNAPMNFNEALEKAEKENDKNLFFDSNGVFSVEAIRPAGKRLGIFIGPEGGWSDNELEAVKKIKNLIILSLGKLTLRAETAAIIASYIAVNAD